MSKRYFEIKYQGPFKGNNVALPEDVIGREYSPFLNNFILKNGELRTRPWSGNILPPTPDGFPIIGITSFLDANNVFHTVAVTGTGLFQLNKNWNRLPYTPLKTWSRVGTYPIQPGPNIPFASSVFTNKIFWTNGGTNLWFWDGIASVNSPRKWQSNTSYVQGTQIQDTNGNLQVAQNAGISGSTQPTWINTLGSTVVDNTGTGFSTTPITWQENGKAALNGFGFTNAAYVDAANGVTAGAYFLIELNAQLLMLNTVESVGGNFPQRIRWCASGLPTVWDSNLNIGAGFNDELDVPDAITGAFTVGTTAFVLRTNGITEITINGSSATNPFAFNHLWASDRGIGNVFPFGYASYGPLGMFIALDDIYNVSLGGFKKVGGVSRDAIFNDLAAATNIPIASILPQYSSNYVYNHYRLEIPQGPNSVRWRYSFEDDSWQRDSKSNTNFTGTSRISFVG